MGDDTLLCPDFLLAGVIEVWAAWLHEEGDGDERCERISEQTHTGRP